MLNKFSWIDGPLVPLKLSENLKILTFTYLFIHLSTFYEREVCLLIYSDSLDIELKFAADPLVISLD